MSGFAEAHSAFVHAPGASPAQGGDLWGALKGTVHVPTGTDLTAPLGEAWGAEA